MQKEPCSDAGGQKDVQGLPEPILFQGSNSTKITTEILAPGGERSKEPQGPAAGVFSVSRALYGSTFTQRKDLLRPCGPSFASNARAGRAPPKKR